ncbi:hypothetical protein GGR53DRAFT_509802 [Hypoxylon sp. FL1150]|nr:hypothetical protein GGR53DRAFT_509802 [Hypoxylon sp. FL1150]
MAEQPTDEPSNESVTSSVGDTGPVPGNHDETPTPSHQTAPPAPASTGAKPSIKLDDIGLFSPSGDQEKSSGVVYFDNRIQMLVFTEVNCFILQIYNLLDDPATILANERHVMSHLPSLLLGGAAQWWYFELTGEDRKWFREAGLQHLLPALGRRFSSRYTIVRAPLSASTGTPLEC